MIEHSSEQETSDVPPLLSAALPQDERYFTLLATAIRKCKTYKPKFGQGRGEGLTLQTFSAMYAADPFYHWLGLDSPLMYAAHKAAGGMTSVYRQIGIGSQWIFYQMLQDHLGLSALMRCRATRLRGVASASAASHSTGGLSLRAFVMPLHARGSSSGCAPLLLRLSFLMIH